MDKSRECDKDRSTQFYGIFVSCQNRNCVLLSLSHSRDLSIMSSLLISRRKIVERNGATF
jgi:hypothetical protein